MTLIFRIAAGIIIGLLCYKIIDLRLGDYNYQQHSARTDIFYSIDTDFQRFLMRARQYYLKYGRLPIYASDIDCKRKSLCGARSKNGNFYFSNNYHWMAISLYLEEGNLRYRCEVTFDVKSDRRGVHYYEQCNKVEGVNLPVFERPPFSCKHPKNKIEVITCLSDRLIALENKLQASYAGLLLRSSEYQKRKLFARYKIFDQDRLSACSKEQCLLERNSKMLMYLTIL